VENVERVVRAQDSTTTDPSVIKANIFFGIRLQTTFMANQNFYKNLGFFTRDYIIDFYRETGRQISSLLKINQQSDFARLGFIRELTFTVMPADPARVIPPYGAKYNIGVAYSVSESLPDLIALMYDFEFYFGTGIDQYLYKILAGSIKEKKSRRTTPNFS